MGGTLLGFHEQLRMLCGFWQEECGHEFLFNPEAMRRASDYVEKNPMKKGLPHSTGHL